MRKRIVSIAVTLMMIMTLLPLQVFATDSVSMTTYNQVIKSGNTAYCSGAGGIYKVSLKNGRAVKVKRIYKGEVFGGAYRSATNMKKKGNNIYFLIWTETYPAAQIKKVNTKNAKTKALTGYVDYIAGYAIKDKKIYFSKEVDYIDDYTVYKTKSMNLNGTSKKTVSVKVSMKSKKSNVSGYRTIVKKKGKYAVDYLKTPKGKFYLGKTKIKKGICN